MKKYVVSVLSLFLFLFLLLGSPLAADGMPSNPTRVTGIVTLNGSPVAGAKVKVFKDGVLKGNTTTSINGVYAFGGPCSHWPAGTYDVSAGYKVPGQPAYTGENSVTRNNSCDIGVADISLQDPS